MQDSAEEKEERKGQEWSAPCYFDISIMGCGDSFGAAPPTLWPRHCHRPPHLLSFAALRLAHLRAVGAGECSLLRVTHCASDAGAASLTGRAR